MRKITTLLTLLLVAVGVSAQSWTIDVDYEHGTFYRYKNGYTITQNTPGSPYSGTPVDAAGSPSSNYGAWAYKWVSAVSGAPEVTVTADTSNKSNKFETTKHLFTSGTNLTWSIEVEDGYVITGYTIEGATEGGTLTLTPNGGTATEFTTSDKSLNVNDLESQTITYKTTGGGSDVRFNYTKFQVKIEKAPTVTYKVMWNGTTKVAEAETTKVVGAASLPASLQRAFCTYTYSPSTITDATSEVIVTATWNGPFVIANSFSEANWYFLKSNEKDL